MLKRRFENIITYLRHRITIHRVAGTGDIGNMPGTTELETFCRWQAKYASMDTCEASLRRRIIS